MGSGSRPPRDRLQSRHPRLIVRAAHLNGNGFDEREVKGKASWLGQRLKKLLKGTEFEYCSGWHIRRHSMISILGQTNDRELVMSLVGHQTEMVHLGYRHSSMSAKAEALQGIDLGVSKGKRGTEGYRTTEQQCETQREMHFMLIY